MSEFKFACPVCGQHISADSRTGGSQIDCPTCFRKIVVPQAPASDDTKLILSAAQVGKPRPSYTEGNSQLHPLRPAPNRISLTALFVWVVLLGAAVVAVYFFRDRIVKAVHGPGPAHTNTLPQPAVAVPLNPVYPVPTNIAWAMNLTNSTFPEMPAAGSIHGSGFLCERAILRGGHLSLSQGQTSPWDLALALNLFAHRGEELSGRTVEIDPARTRAPAVVLHWKESGQRVATQTISGGYALRLLFGQATNGRMPGKIYLCLPDSSNSFVAGTFDAEIRQPLASNAAPPSPPRR